MKFSIITITFNRAHLIEKTIKSVLAQTYKNWEQIIIDDGSTDNTREVIDQFTDTRVKYFKTSKQTQRSYLRNLGIHKSTGEIICILDSDDLWLPEKLEELSKVFNSNPDINFVFHNALLMEKKKNNVIYRYKKSFYKNVLTDILESKLLPYPFYAFRKTLLSEVSPYDEHIIDGQQDFFIRVAEIYPFFFLNMILAHKIHSENNLSTTRRISTFFDFNNTLDRLFKTNRIDKKRYRKIQQLNYFKIAKFCILQDEHSKAQMYLLKVLKEFRILNKVYIKTLLLCYFPFLLRKKT